MKGELTMRALIILVITFAILATQFYWGVRKKKILGAIIPLVMTALFITISFLEKAAEYAITGIISIVAIIIVWFIGYFKSAKYEKSEIDKMKAKDIQ
jgi:hypothetical protein